jgi:ectoine hydroxylase
MKLSQTQLDQYKADGFIRIDGLFSPAEVALLRQECARMGTDNRNHADANVMEKGSGKVRISYAVEQDSDALDAAYRLPRIMEPICQLLGDDIYLWQSRLIHKLARYGELWQWHQDYTSWALDGAKRSTVNDMMSVLIQVDDSSAENGPLKVVRGSHMVSGPKESGVLDWDYDDYTTSYPVHTVSDAEQERLFADHDVVEFDAPAGTVLFFGAMTVHCSGPNTSGNDRRNLYYVYNRLDNQPDDRLSKREAITNSYYLNTSWERFDAAPDDALMRIAEAQGIAA